jgi:hypothetical protein
MTNGVTGVTGVTTGGVTGVTGVTTGGVTVKTWSGSNLPACTGIQIVGYPLPVPYVEVGAGP